MDKDNGCPRFGVARRCSCTPAHSFFNLSDTLKNTHNRLKGVIIENLDWRECIARYDTDVAFFYLDPPYENFETVYGKGVFAKSDFVELAKVLAHIKGNFLLSISDSPFIREIFSDFDQRTVEATYTVKFDPRSRDPENLGRTKVNELLISNYLANLTEGVSD